MEHEHLLLKKQISKHITKMMLQTTAAYIRATETLKFFLGRHHFHLAEGVSEVFHVIVK